MFIAHDKAYSDKTLNNFNLNENEKLFYLKRILPDHFCAILKFQIILE